MIIDNAQTDFVVLKEIKSNKYVEVYVNAHDEPAGRFVTDISNATIFHRNHISGRLLDQHNIDWYDYIVEDATNVPVVVEYWPRGYASNEGPKRLITQKKDDYRVDLYGAGDPYGLVFSVRPRIYVPRVRPEQAEYFKGDNS